MASNPNVNKVVYGNDTLIDLTEDTVTADKILQGYTAHDRSGAGITGTYVAPATPTDITPSNTTPPALSIDVPVNPKDTGHAIKSYVNTTPTLEGVYFPSGFNRMGISGYAYSQEPEVEDYEDILSPTEGKTYTLTDLEVGKKYLLFVWNWKSSEGLSNTRFDGTTASGGTLTKITNLRESSGSARVAGTFFLLEANATSVTLTCENIFQTHLITAVGGVVPTPATEIETRLWANPDLTANFSAQEVTLSDNYTNYDKIRFYYYSYDGSASVETYVEYAKEEIDKWGRQGSVSNGSILGSIAQYYSSTSYARPILKKSSGNNGFYFYNAGKVNGSGTGTSVCKPTKITGITKVVA